MTTSAAWLERHQVALYLAALGVGAAVGLSAPGVAAIAEAAVPLVLGLLMYVTFLAVPFPRIALGLRDWRFLVAVGAVNFVAAPVVVFALSRFVAHDLALVVGVLFVLLTPCIDYVIAFTGLAGGASDRLLAAAPLLLIGQMLLLPPFVWLMLGGDVVASIDARPFVAAFGWLIALPLAAATITQIAAPRIRIIRAIGDGAVAAMVPLMMLTLAAVVASQIASVGLELERLAPVVPLFVAFAAIMLPIGLVAGRIMTLDAPGTRAVTFSGVTRNSLVVLPLVLALPSTYGVAPLVVVAQTMVELLVMVAMVRFVPRVVRARA